MCVARSIADLEVQLGTAAVPLWAPHCGARLGRNLSFMAVSYLGLLAGHPICIHLWCFFSSIKGKFDENFRKLHKLQVFISVHKCSIISSYKLALKQIGSNKINTEIILIPTEVWNVNSFDQWGVELGKVLGVKVRKYLSQARSGGMGPMGWDANMLEHVGLLEPLNQLWWTVLKCWVQVVGMYQDSKSLHSNSTLQSQRLARLPANPSLYAIYLHVCRYCRTIKGQDMMLRVKTKYLLECRKL